MLAELRKKLLGFTLIELLVVMLVVAILMASIGFSFSGSNTYYSANGYAQRLAQRVEMARDRAVASNIEWGMFVEQDGYRFTRFDQQFSDWVEVVNKPFAFEKSKYTINLKIEVESITEELGRVDEELPDVIFFSSGEVIPFELSLEMEELPGMRWILESDGFSQVSVSQDQSL